MKPIVQRTFGKTKLWVIKNKPEIMYWSGIASGGVSLYYTIKATLKIRPIIDEFNEEVLKIHSDFDEGWIDAAKESKHLTKLYFKTAGKILKLYSPAIGAAALSVALTHGAKSELKARNAKLTAAYAGLEAAYNALSVEARKKYGDEAEELQKPRERVVDTVTGEVTDEGKPEEVGDYGRLFAEGYSNAWQANNGYNINFLKAQQAYANQILECRGYLFLHEVYAMLGVKDSEAAHLVGWVWSDDPNHNGDNYVSFGIDDIHKPRICAYLQGETDELWLDFNCQGTILDKIGLRKI